MYRDQLVGNVSVSNVTFLKEREIEREREKVKFLEISLPPFSSKPLINSSVRT
jgi:hypothetical protein